MGLLGRVRRKPCLNLFVLWFLLVPTFLSADPPPESECQSAILSGSDLEIKTAIEAAEILVKKAEIACHSKQGCRTPFEQATHLAQHTKWENTKLVARRAAYITVWLSLTFGSTLGAYQLGNQMGKGVGVALSMSTSVLGAAILMPFGKAFIFKLMNMFEKAGHNAWKGKDAWSRDKRRYNEIEKFRVEQALKIRQAILPNLAHAVRNLRHGEAELAADKIAEATRVAYRAFQGVHSNDTTVADAINTFFKSEAEIPKEFYDYLEKKVFFCRWPDVPIEEPECRLFLSKLLGDWFPERP